MISTFRAGRPCNCGFTVSEAFIEPASHRRAVCQQDIILAAATQCEIICIQPIPALKQQRNFRECDEEGGRDAAFCTRGYFIQNNDSG